MNTPADDQCPDADGKAPSPPPGPAMPAANRPRAGASNAAMPSGALDGRGAASVAVAMLLVGGAAIVPDLFPYHERARAVYLTAAPLSAGYLLGAAAPGWTRRHVARLLAALVVLVLAVLWPGLRSDIPARALWPVVGGGLFLAVAFARVGMLQAGVGWGGRPVENEAPRWASAVALAVVWAWLLGVMLNPRESFPPTRWLLTLVGNRPAPSTLEPARVHMRQYAITGRPVGTERAGVEAGPYYIALIEAAPRRGQVMVVVSARRRDGAPLDRPMWLTIDADDPQRPDADNDAELYNMGVMEPGNPAAGAALGSAGARRFTQVAWFSISQSLPAVRLRARLWELRARDADGTLTFRPVAQADLGAWDLTVLRWLRAQPRPTSG